MRRVGVGALAAAVLVALVLAAVVSAQGDEEVGKVERRKIGRGADAVWVLRPSEADGPLPAVVFLHGWGAVGPDSYGPWLDHLVQQGQVVIYPVYQSNGYSLPNRALGDALRGIRAALAEEEIERDSLVVAGHSAGGSLAADYAASAATAGVPRPKAVLSMYPGRSLRGFPLRIPVVDPALIAPETRIVAMAGSDDRVVGDATARAIVRGAVRVPDSRKTFELVTDPAVRDHWGPQRVTPAAQRIFWRRLDRLAAEARRR